MADRNGQMFVIDVTTPGVVEPTCYREDDVTHQKMLTNAARDSFRHDAGTEGVITALSTAGVRVTKEQAFDALRDVAISLDQQHYQPSAVEIRQAQMDWRDMHHLGLTRGVGRYIDSSTAADALKAVRVFNQERLPVSIKPGSPAFTTQRALQVAEALWGFRTDLQHVEDATMRPKREAFGL